MPQIKRFDHVGITVADLDIVTAFFVGLGFEVEGRADMAGEFVDTVIGIPHSRSKIVTLRRPAVYRRLRADRRHRPVRGRMAHGLRARTRGNHCRPGPTHRVGPDP